MNKFRFRDRKVDILKGIGIIMMTLGHCHAPCRFAFYLFHVAVFFVASGYFYKESNSESIKSVYIYFAKKLRGLWLPYFLSIAFFTVTHNLQLKMGILTTDTRVLELTGGNYDYEMLAETWGLYDILNSLIRAFLFGGGVSFAGNIWFLRVLFIISVMYCFISYMISQKAKRLSGVVLQTVISVIFLLIGFAMQKRGVRLYGISTAFSCYCLYHVGTLLKHIKNKNIIIHICTGLASIVLLTVLYIRGIGILQTALVSNQYLNPAFLVITSLAGWFAMYLSAIVFEKIPLISRFLCSCGRHSLIIMILHPVCFKIVNLIQVRYYKLPGYYLAAYPVIYSENLWWLVCTIFGVIVPLGLGITYSEVRNRLTNLCNIA